MDYCSVVVLNSVKQQLIDTNEMQIRCKVDSALTVSLSKCLTLLFPSGLVFLKSGLYNGISSSYFF